MLRHLASEHPGDVRLCVFDPVGLGQSVGDVLNLAEYDPDLISGKVWSSAQDLDGRLAELAAHIELVIQKYLRTAYETIDDFNADAGEVAEPYRVLVLFDFPTSLSEESASRLKSILQNGPRCGVFTIMALEETANAQYGVGVSALTNATRRLALESGFQAEVDGYKLRYSFEPEVLPEANSVAQQVIEAIGREAATRTATAVSVDKTFGLFNAVATRGLRAELPAAATRTRFHDPSTWWQNDTVRGISAPIGQKGAREAAILTFDSGDHAGGLLVGRPGSGKTTLLHSYIAGLTTLYSPEELSLYLIDFKEGVEFKVYAEEGLPHARVVAVESDREFGLSVLESVQLEISRRGELLRGTGGRQASMQALRQATGQTMPRILLIFDEFQVLFARNDKLGLSAADLLESIIRQGRGFGVHVLLGSQSLAGMDALGSHVHQLLPVKILLPASEQDAHKVLGDTNNAGSYLATAGEGILNAAGGAIESNERFKGSILTEMDRVVRLQVMREKADTLGFMTRPMVFEGSKAAPLDTVSPASFREELAATGWAPLRIRAGRPMAVGQLGDLTLTRDAGANVLAIMRSTDTQIGGESSGALALGLVAISVASVATSSANIDIIDFLSNDDGLDAALEPFLETQRITLRRRRAFRDTLERYAAELSDRIERDDTRAGARVLFLVGIHRARELDADSGSLDADEDLAEMLTQVMRDGPEFGIHVWMWAESLSAVARRLTSDMMREIGWRIAGRMSGEDSDRLIGNRLASELRDNQLVLTNDDFGISTRVIAYQPPSRIWLTELANLTPHNNGDSHA
ncbi:MAG: AAA family ATPase [Micropruina sp.]|nr:MAG: AAA family ATPase [Micropruina sp.]